MNKLSFYYIDIMVKKNSYFNSTTIILLGLLLLLLAFAIPLFVNDNKVNNMSKQLDVIEQFYSKKRREKRREKFENNDETNKPKLEFYSMNGCHHCNKFKTTWGKIKVHPELGKYAVEIGPESPDYDKLCRTHGIRGFPHIQLTKNGVKISEYKGLRNLEDIYKWVKNNLV